ncbi:hypothetical protein NHQ30_009176 [Ciborinia camelliae]|nr:hypothetical protein NHQ30_009176 [Ciborinia camelliae]
MANIGGDIMEDIMENTMANIGGDIMENTMANTGGDIMEVDAEGDDLTDIDENVQEWIKETKVDDLPSSAQGLKDELAHFLDESVLVAFSTHLMLPGEAHPTITFEVPTSLHMDKGSYVSIRMEPRHRRIQKSLFKKARGVVHYPETPNSRRSWRMPADAFRQEDERWNRSLEQAVKRVEVEQGLEANTFVLELYQLILYGAGAKKESCEIEGLDFGYLDIILPFRKRGEMCILDIDGKETKWSMKDLKLGYFSHAWFTGHEITTSAYCGEIMTLRYKLKPTVPTMKRPIDAFSSSLSQLEIMLSKWKENSSVDNAMLGCVLSKEYPNSLAYNKLNLIDRKLVYLITQAYTNLGFVGYLVNSIHSEIITNEEQEGLTQDIPFAPIYSEMIMDEEQEGLIQGVGFVDAGDERPEAPSRPKKVYRRSSRRVLLTSSMTELDGNTWFAKPVFEIENLLQKDVFRSNENEIEIYEKQGRGFPFEYRRSMMVFMPRPSQMTWFLSDAASTIDVANKLLEASAWLDPKNIEDLSTICKQVLPNPWKSIPQGREGELFFRIIRMLIDFDCKSIFANAFPTYFSTLKCRDLKNVLIRSHGADWFLKMVGEQIPKMDSFQIKHQAITAESQYHKSTAWRDFQYKQAVASLGLFPEQEVVPLLEVIHTWAPSRISRIVLPIIKNNIGRKLPMLAILIEISKICFSSHDDQPGLNMIFQEAFPSIEGALRLHCNTGIILDNRAIAPGDLASIFCFAYKLKMFRETERFFYSLSNQITRFHPAQAEALFSNYYFPFLRSCGQSLIANGLSSDLNSRIWSLLYFNITSCYIVKSQILKPTPVGNWIRKSRGCGCCTDCKMADALLSDPLQESFGLYVDEKRLAHLGERLSLDRNDKIVVWQVPQEVQNPKEFCLMVQKIELPFNTRMDAYAEDCLLVKKFILEALGEEIAKLAFGEHYSNILSLQPVFTHQLP